jgi:hypothetical protein
MPREPHHSLATRQAASEALSDPAVCGMQETPTKPARNACHSAQRWASEPLATGHKETLHGTGKRDSTLDFGSADSDHPSARDVLPSLSRFVGGSQRDAKSEPRDVDPAHCGRLRRRSCSFAPITPAGVPVVAAFRAAYRYEARPGAIQYSARSISTRSRPSRSSRGPSG